MGRLKDELDELDKKTETVEVLDSSRNPHQFPTNPDKMSFGDSIRAGALDDKAFDQLNKIHGAYRKKK